MNVKLLRKVKRHILAEPKRLQMWCYVKLKGYSTWTGKDHLSHQWARCGTAGCIAGWTCILEYGKKDARKMADSVHIAATRLLGLTKDQADILFIPSSWPYQFQDGANDDGKASTAKIVAARIEHFIKTKGAE